MGLIQEITREFKIFVGLPLFRKNDIIMLEERVFCNEECRLNYGKRPIGRIESYNPEKKEYNVVIQHDKISYLYATQLWRIHKSVTKDTQRTERKTHINKLLAEEYFQTVSAKSLEEAVNLYGAKIVSTKTANSLLGKRQYFS